MSQTKLIVILGAIIICAVLFGALGGLTTTLASDITTVIENR